MTLFAGSGVLSAVLQAPFCPGVCWAAGDLNSFVVPEMNLLEKSFSFPRGTAVITHHHTGVKLKALGLFHALPGGRQR